MMVMLKMKKVTSLKQVMAIETIKFRFMLGVFYTKWQDRFIWSDNFEVNGVDYQDQFYGLTQMHKGIEFQLDVN